VRAVEPWLERQARERPDAPAVDAVTYAELLERARRTPAPGPIALPPGPGFAVALHAHLLRGVPAVPVDLRLPEEEQARRAATTAGGEDVVLVVFTSGTSGAPKPVELTHANVLANAEGSARALGVTSDDRWLCPLPLVHVGGLLILLRAVIGGFTALLDPPFDAGRVAARLNAGEATLVSMVPTMLARALDAGLREPSGLRAVVSGGAPLDPVLRARAQDAGVPVVDAYGLTETTSQFTGDGRVFHNASVRLAGDGEIHVTGPMVAGGGELATGDLGRFEDGRLRIVGRKADTIVTGGENVEPAEVEAVLLAHPAVSEAGVFGRPDPEWGEAVTAHVVGDADPAELRAWCAERLAPFQVPKQIEVVRSLPRTPSGKLLRRSMG
jgi:O-succinylbenzoic acid--CoA ligase